MWAKLNKLIIALLFLNQNTLLAQKESIVRMDFVQPLFGSFSFSFNPNAKAKFVEEYSFGYSGNWSNAYLGVTKNAGMIGKYGVYIYNYKLFRKDDGFNVNFFVKPEISVFTHSANFLIYDRYFSAQSQMFQTDFVNYKVKVNGASLLINLGQSININKFIFDYYAGFGIMFKSLNIKKDNEDATDLKENFQIFAPNYIYGYQKIKETFQFGARVGYVISQ